MRHRINPLVDYAFKRLLGTEANKNLTLHFLNAILRPRPPIAEIALVDPFNGRDHAEDKLSVVDVKARDVLGRGFQIEVQVRLHQAVRERALYTWADLYQEQLGRGEDYKTLQPVYAIWLLDEVLLPESPAVHHRFTAFDREHGVTLCDHLNLHVLELPKLPRLQEPLDDEQRWCTFFRQARRWTELPRTLDTPELRQAMGTLIEISDREREYHRYASRLDALRVQRTIENAEREARTLLAEAEARLEAERAERAAVEARLEAERAAAALRLEQARQALRDAGLDPDALLPPEP